MRLLAPESYRRATASERRRFCNGCGGAATGWLSWLINWLVPNHIWGVCIKPACDIHDWCYAHGIPKFLSDLILLCNALILCWYGGSRWLFVFRAMRCMTYFLAVTLFGRRFYGRKVADKLMRRRARG